MIRIHEKTLKDLEFFTVLEQISEHTITALGKKAALAILPIEVEAQLIRELDYVNEYVSSFDNDNRIPNHGFETISKELKLLNIENTLLKGVKFDYSLYNQKDKIHKLSHQHLHTKFWIVEVDKLPEHAISIKDLKKYPSPVLISDFIKDFNFKGL